MSRNLSVLVVLIVMAGCALHVPEAQADSTASADVAFTFIHESWAPVKSLHALPTELMAILTSRFLGDPRLADVLEPFDATDVTSGLPTRRFLLGGVAAQKCFVAYERGGRGHHMILVMFDTSRHPPVPVMLARGQAGHHDDVAGWGIGIHELQAALQHGELRRDDPNSSYY